MRTKPGDYPLLTRLLVRFFFGESRRLKQAGLAGMPKPFLPWYLLSAGAAFIFFSTWSRWQRIGVDNIPRGRGVMMVSNHVSSADPPILAASIYPRWPKYMAKLELFQKRYFGPIFALSGAFPVKRFEADLAALREAERHLEEGEVLGMFPEGHRSDTGGLMEAYPGTALIALRANPAIVPVAITGSEKLRAGWRVFFQRPNIRIVFGKPFQLDHEGRVTREVVAAATERIMRAIAVQLPASYRGVYRDRFADLPDEAAVDRTEAAGKQIPSA